MTDCPKRWHLSLRGVLLIYKPHFVWTLCHLAVKSSSSQSLPASLPSAALLASALPTKCNSSNIFPPACCTLHLPNLFSLFEKIALTYIYLLKEFCLFIFTSVIFDGLCINTLFWLFDFIWKRKYWCLETEHEKMRLSCLNIFTLQTKASFIYIEICVG